MTLKAKLLTLVACLSLTSVLMAQTPAPVTLTIVHFNDVYEISPVEGGKSGGLARVATRIKQLAPQLVTLGGDYLSPSALGTARVDGQQLAGKQMVDVLNHVGVQWATLGNHEFDVSEAAFKARMAEQKFSVVVSNATDAQGQPLLNTVPTAIVPVKVGGRTVRVGLIGIIIDSNQKPWVKYLDPVASAKEAVASLAGKVDTIIALTHLSLAGDTAHGTFVAPTIIEGQFSDEEVRGHEVRIGRQDLLNRLLGGRRVLISEHPGHTNGRAHVLGLCRQRRTE